MGRRSGNQLSTFNADSKSAKIQKYFVSIWGGGGGVWEATSVLLMLNPNLLKSKIPYIVVGWGRIWEFVNQLPTLDVVSKSAKIQNSLC